MLDVSAGGTSWEFGGIVCFAIAVLWEILEGPHSCPLLVSTGISILYDKLDKVQKQ